MNKEEYIKYVENNEDLSRTLEISSTINTIVEILINKNICEIEEFKSTKQKYKNQMLDDSYAREKPEDLEAVKTIDNFFNMFKVKE